jgi:hypothetical protein
MYIYKHTHIHTYTYIHTYIKRERIRENMTVFVDLSEGTTCRQERKKRMSMNNIEIQYICV